MYFGKLISSREYARIYNESTFFMMAFKSLSALSLSTFLILFVSLSSLALLELSLSISPFSILFTLMV